MSRSRDGLRLAVALLDAATAQSAERITSGWGERHWQEFERTLTAHGLNAWLWEELGDERLGRVLPHHTVERIHGQHAAHTERVDALHEDLVAVLRAAGAAGIGIMPLKGALLTTRERGPRTRRPMSDLDLLVRPADRAAMASVLEGLGYRHVPENNPRPSHDVFARPGDDRVVSAGEHVDNPRRIELHTEVMRHLWGWIDGDDLTPALWQRATTGQVLGEPAIIPADEDLAAHLAIHASSDLLVGRGRLIQWLDFVHVEAALRSTLPDVPHPQLAYPSIGLAYRAVPQLGDIDPLSLARLVPRRLARWVDSVPLDDRSGLIGAGRLPMPSSWRARWKRWAPYRWRMAVAYGDVPLTVGLTRHLSMLTGHARRANRASPERGKT